MIEIVVLTIIRTIIVIITMAIGIKSYFVSKFHPDNKLTYILLTCGFLIVGIAAAIEGILYQFYHLDLIIVHSIESLLTALGLFLILLAIYLNRF